MRVIKVHFLAFITNSVLFPSIGYCFLQVLILGVLLSPTGCTTTGQSVLLGAGIGAAGGAGLGIAVEQSPGSALIGAGIGALLTGTLSYLCHKNKEREDERLKLARSYGRPEPVDPTLTSPEVRREWVPDTIHGNTLIRGHWKYVIDRQSTWGGQ